MDLDKLKARIQALRAKTTDQGCTEQEAISAAAKVAELLDRHDLSFADLDRREDLCTRGAFETYRKKRVPLDSCIGAIAHFCDCRVWREKNAAGTLSYVFFGLHADVAVALYLADVVDLAIRTELGRYKNSPAYLRFRHNERALANSSFALGMVSSIATKLTVMKQERDGTNRCSGRDLVVAKASVVAEELARLGLTLRQSGGGRRMVSPNAFDAGKAVGESLPITPGIPNN